jgi:hypothetical protein
MTQTARYIVDRGTLKFKSAMRLEALVASSKPPEAKLSLYIVPEGEPMYLPDQEKHQ